MQTTFLVAEGICLIPGTGVHAPVEQPVILTRRRVVRPGALHAILARRRRIVIPWQMGWVAKLLRILPAWLYDRLFANSLRKPRQGEIPPSGTGGAASPRH